MNIREFAKAVGVSKATVWRAVNGSPDIKPETRSMILRRMEELNYQPSRAGQALATGRSNVVAFWVPGLCNSYALTLLQTMYDQVHDLGYDLMVRDVSYGRQRDGGRREVADWPLDGAIVVDGADWLEGLLSAPRKHAYPLVSMGMYCATCVDHVEINPRAGFAAAIDHLFAGGCRRVAYLGPDQGPGEPRISIYLETMAAHGAEPEFIYIDTYRRLEIAREVTEYVEARGVPEGIISYNDDCALGAMRGLAGMGYRVPDDVLLVGCDGIEDGRFVQPELSTIEIPMTDICARAWDLLQRRIEDPDRPLQRVVCEPSLVIRGTSVRRQTV